MSLFPTWIAHTKAIAETLRTYRLHMSGAFTLRQELAPYILTVAFTGLMQTR